MQKKAPCKRQMTPQTMTQKSDQGNFFLLPSFMDIKWLWLGIIDSTKIIKHFGIEKRETALEPFPFQLIFLRPPLYKPGLCNKTLLFGLFEEQASGFSPFLSCFEKAWTKIPLSVPFFCTSQTCSSRKEKPDVDLPCTPQAKTELHGQASADLRLAGEAAAVEVAGDGVLFARGQTIYRKGMISRDILIVNQFT